MTPRSPKSYMKARALEIAFLIIKTAFNFCE